MESLFDIQKDIFDNIKEYFKKFKILKKCLEMKRFKLIKIIKLAPNKIGNKKFKFEMIYNSYIEKLSIFFLKLKNKKNSINNYLKYDQIKFKYIKK